MSGVQNLYKAENPQNILQKVKASKDYVIFVLAPILCIVGPTLTLKSTYM